MSQFTSTRLVLVLSWVHILNPKYQSNANALRFARALAPCQVRKKRAMATPHRRRIPSKSFLLLWSDSLPFRDHVEAVHRRWSRNRLGLTARAPNLDLVDLRRFAKTEVGPLIRARGKATSRKHICALRKAVRGKQNACTNRIARTPALCACR